MDTEVIKEYTEALLNGTYPVLSDNLVPITIADNGTVTKADTNTEWYKYEDKKWANAVILADNTKTYNKGDVIPEDNIESYFVWIPKYSYQIFNLGETDGDTGTAEPTSQEIQIKFGTTNTSDYNENECTTPMTSGASGNCKVGDYMTSPAFISMNTNGLWVAKIETTYSKRILGDATGEMGPFYYYEGWYSDGSGVVDSSDPWFCRGGFYDDGVLAGQFYSYHDTGGARSSVGLRLVLTK